VGSNRKEVKHDAYSAKERKRTMVINIAKAAVALASAAAIYVLVRICQEGW